MLLLSSAACGWAAAATWRTVAPHQLRAHGSTQENEMRIVAGLTWTDSAKVLPLALVLLVPGLVCAVVPGSSVRVHRRRRCAKIWP